MKFTHVTLENCTTAKGIVVVIDVLRAFTTAAFAFAAGAERIVLVGEVEEALAWRRRDHQALLMGEVGGLHIPGFDFGNSPAEIETQDLRGRRLIQRTSSGTQGIILSHNAQTLLAASFCVAGATVRFLQQLAPEGVTFVSTGVRADGRGDEDVACAEYLEAILKGQRPNPQPYLDRVRNSVNGRIFADPHRPEFPSADLERSLRLDAFHFAMPVYLHAGDWVMTAVPNQAPVT